MNAISYAELCGGAPSVGFFPVAHPFLFDGDKRIVGEKPEIDWGQTLFNAGILAIPVVVTAVWGWFAGLVVLFLGPMLLLLVAP